MLQRSIVWTAIVAFALAVLPAHAAPHAVALVDQRDRPFTLETLGGDGVLLGFASAHCADVCPLLLADIARAARDPRNARLRFVTITLDPERDGRNDLRTLALRFGAIAPHWRVARGSVRDVHALMERFGVRVQRGVDGYADAHTVAVYLLSPRGELARTLLPSSDLTAQIGSR